MISNLLSRLVILVFGTLYPAYASYKAIKSKNVREYVKWMMYWIVFALFTCAETFTDIFFSFWFPFYYEVKIMIVIWLLCPATKGSSIMYRNFVHPWLSTREQEIDEYIMRAKEQSYATVLQLGSKGFNYASNVIMQTALKSGGGLVSQLRRSYSLSDLSMGDAAAGEVSHTEDSVDSTTPVTRSSRKTTIGSQANLYFPPLNENESTVSSSRKRNSLSDQVHSVEDISSGYGSTESVFASSSDLQSSSPLTRSGSVGSSRIRTRALTGASKKTAPTQIKDRISSKESNLAWNNSQSVLQLSSPFDNEVSVTNTVYATLPRSRRAPRKKTQ